MQRHTMQTSRDTSTLPPASAPAGFTRIAGFTLATTVVLAAVVLGAAPALAARPAPSWQTLGGPFGGGATALATTPADPAEVVTIAGGVLFTSGNGGARWSRLLFPKHEVGFVAIDPLAPARLWASGTDLAAGGPGSFTSDDGGRSWVQVHGGPFDPGISGIAFAPSDPRVAYGVSRLGVFRSDDRGA